MIFVSILAVSKEDENFLTLLESSIIFPRVSTDMENIFALVRFTLVGSFFQNFFNSNEKLCHKLRDRLEAFLALVSQIQFFFVKFFFGILNAEKFC